MSETQRIQVHPLVVMNISDHFTRAKYRQPKGVPGYRVIGLILGRQDGRLLDIMNTFETDFTARDPSDAQLSAISFEQEYTRGRIAAYKEMYPDLEVVGWYSAKGASSFDVSCDQPTPDDLAAMRDDVSQFCENPLMLIMNPNSQQAKDKKKIHFFLYQSGQQGLSPQGFTQVDYALASEDSEQIAVDGVARAIDPDAKYSAFAQQMAAPINAVKLLRSKINFLITVVKNCPEVRQNKALMRRLNQIVNSAPIVASEEYDAQFFGEFADATALNILTSVTQSCKQIQSLLDDYRELSVGVDMDYAVTPSMEGGMGSNRMMRHMNMGRQPMARRPR